jgi:hypothetical protein
MHALEVNPPLSRTNGIINRVVSSYNFDCIQIQHLSTDDTYIKYESLNQESLLSLSIFDIVHVC